LDYKWVETASWRTACRISCLSWNLEGTRLLTGGSVLQLWHQQLPDEIIDGNTGIYDLFITVFIIKNNLFVSIQIIYIYSICMKIIKFCIKFVLLSIDFLHNLL